ncbi:SH3 domain-containing protein [Lactobacillus sp. DCY120]|uniref:SH3 domain-containing protein n=1 Tax=Bombilactobacillus apium TaxID=2675299 RepID=A0A850R221_9LACO|nr:SH3 domain-containing protein [Bombilactobacillus apium]NVY96400.1 SH3 domain-containing protein [Bombilactobacillus apium]
MGSYSLSKNVSGKFKPLTATKFNTSKATDFHPEHTFLTTMNHNKSYRFVYPANIYSEPHLNAAIVGQFQTGETLYYQARIYARGQTWLKYYNVLGKFSYVALRDHLIMTTQVPAPRSLVASASRLPAAGSYQFLEPAAIRLAPSLQGKIVGYYHPGEQVFYQEQLQANGSTWLKYSTPLGQNCYVEIALE